MKEINVTLTEDEVYNLWAVLGEFRRITRDQCKNSSSEIYDIACSLYKKLVETDKD
jgi:hypothetical protein